VCVSRDDDMITCFVPHTPVTLSWHLNRILDPPIPFVPHFKNDFYSLCGVSNRLERFVQVSVTRGINTTGATATSASQHPPELAAGRSDPQLDHLEAAHADADLVSEPLLPVEVRTELTKPASDLMHSHEDSMETEQERLMRLHKSENFWQKLSKVCHCCSCARSSMLDLVHILRTSSTGALVATPASSFCPQKGIIMSNKLFSPLH
jgi:hypothetical protein